MTKKHKMFDAFVGNRRSGELHRESCAWVKLMKITNQKSFSSIDDAIKSGYVDPCLHCLKDFEDISTVNKGEEGTEEIRDGYFHSHIHNNDRGGNQPTFSILSLEPGSGADLTQVVAFANENQIKYIFLIFAGQQYPDFGRRYDRGDKWFCRMLTGGDKLDAFGHYRIHASDEYTSVAYELFNHYIDNDKNEALIIDVVNTKYNWSKSDSGKDSVEDYMVDIVYEKIYKNIVPSVRDNINFFITGFSRGAVFSLVFADRLKQANPHIKIASVVTVDPVINHGSAKDLRLIRSPRGYGLLKKRKAAVCINGDYFMDSRPEPMLAKNFFPILKGTKTTTNYNVFQRKGLAKKACAKPIGSAVESAISPANTQGGSFLSPINVAKNTEMFNQYDLSVTKHTPDMLDKYWRWILHIATSLLDTLAQQQEGFITKVNFDIFSGIQNISNSANPVKRGTALLLRAEVLKEFPTGSTEAYANQRVRFAVNEFGISQRDLGTAITDSSGVATLSYVVPGNITEGETWFYTYYPEDAADTLSKRYIMIPKLITDAKASPITFQRNTTISFNLNGRANIKVEIFTQAGGFGSLAHRKTLIRDEWLDSGMHTAKWDGTNHNNNQTWKGYYKCRIKSAEGEYVVIGNLHKKGGK